MKKIGFYADPVERIIGHREIAEEYGPEQREAFNLGVICASSVFADWADLLPNEISKKEIDKIWEYMNDCRVMAHHLTTLKLRQRDTGR